MRVVYVDSGAFIALLRRKDQQHDRVAKHFVRLRQAGDRLVTSDAVVSETATRLRYDVGLDAALAFRRLLDAAGSQLAVHDSDARTRGAAFDLMAGYADLRLSYADCVGGVVARAMRAAAVFGLDGDFRVLGFAVEPD
ncbi:MAG TPA: PIN domain-containing protein [Acidimicrobiales bacterium]|nr:PIN domain-containing protein [Acidimicrobiales bacterium]